MSRKLILSIPLIILLLMSACSMPYPSPQVLPSDTPGAATVPVATDTLVAPTNTTAPTDTLQPTNTLAPTATQPAVLPTLTPAPGGTANSNPAAGNYIDDRSTPSQLIVSFYNAINRQEYSRAYGYYANPSSALGAFDAFANGYKNTVSVGITFGQLTSEGAAGSIYFTVPAILTANESGAIQSTYAVCYVIKQPQPANFGAPPFHPMSIQSGSGKKVPTGTDPNTACVGQQTGVNNFPAGTESLSIDKNNFIDNRSGPIETISSFLNAINLKQYVRAYYYFDNAAAFPGNYVPWANGYSNTESVSVSFGTILNEGAAGSLYYKVPMILVAQTTGSVTQTFVGCYTLRLAQPGVQVQPPFRSMGIIGGKFTQVANNADTTAMLPTACNGL